MVPGLSTSSSSSLLSSTSMIPSRQEIDHVKSSSSSSTSPTTSVSSDCETRAREDLSGIDSHPASVSSSQVERKERGDPLYSDIPEWLQEFRENLVDDRVPEHRDSHASSSHEPSLEPTTTRSVDLGKHSVKTHFPKDRNCEICQRTKKITRAPCRRRIGGAVLRAENFGDLITADPKVLSVNLETIIDMQSSCRILPPNGSSRIRAKQKLLRKHKGACKSSWSQRGSLKSFTLTIP